MFPIEELEICDVDIVLRYHRIQALRESDSQITETVSLEYPIDLFIREIKEVEDSVVEVSFMLQSKSRPKLATFTLSGNISISGSRNQILYWITPIGIQPPPIWRYIIQQSLSRMIHLARDIEVPFISHS